MNIKIINEHMKRGDEMVENPINEELDIKKLEKMEKSELIEYIRELEAENREKTIACNSLMKLVSMSETKINRLQAKVEGNLRNAGRKEKFNEEQVKEILKLSDEGMSIRAIARELDCSVGLIHKIIKKNRKEEM